MRRIAVCYHPAVAGARAVAERLAELAGEAGVLAACAELPDAALGLPLAWPDGQAEFAAAELLIAVGGDGTMLHASAIAAPAGVPVFGVRMGRLGFLAESTEAEAERDLRRIIGGAGRIEARTMVQAQVGAMGAPLHALNDVVIGRQHLGRTVSVGLRVDGVLLAEYRADAVVVATATGSTGYALALGGPILHPGASELVVVAVAPHLSYRNALVLPGSASIELEVARAEGCVLLADGGQEQAVEAGARVQVTRSPQTTRFLRLGEERQFYANLARRLGWLRIDHALADRAPGPEGGAPGGV
ncbi:MAG: NAD(+)/NADH kinase [Dehalococcoidia bacterium]|nr:NAD(+)/NADH kinase [Dehalococcoidia bacterium]